MSRRIALAILLTVWAILIAGSVTAYLTVRWAMIDELDQSLLAKASALPQLSDASESAPPSNSAADRYLIKSASGQMISPPAGGLSVSNVKLLTSYFSPLPDGARLRTLLLNATIRDASGKPQSVTVTYQGSARNVDRLLNRLMISFAIFGVTAGLITAGVAVRISRSALKPLYATADVIGTITPQNLSRRIIAERLPPELIPMATKLNDMLERIEQAYKQRHQFLSDASHELRTPVAALVTTAEVSLRHPRQAEQYEQALQTCLGDARLLKTLVERLMEQCRADVLTHDEPVQRLDIVPILKQCLGQVTAIGQGRSIAVDGQMPNELQIDTQPQRLRGIVTNLLSNAVEYNRPGGTVSLKTQLFGREITLEVRDTGVGIAAENLGQLFEPFYRADQSRANDAGHLGLGLSLVKSHVEALGGHISVESTVGKGTTFTVRLPVGRAAEPRLAPKPENIKILS